MVMDAPQEATQPGCEAFIKINFEGMLRIFFPRSSAIHHWYYDTLYIIEPLYNKRCPASLSRYFQWIQEHTLSRFHRYINRLASHMAMLIRSREWEWTSPKRNRTVDRHAEQTDIHAQTLSVLRPLLSLSSTYLRFRLLCKCSYSFYA